MSKNDDTRRLTLVANNEEVAGVQADRPEDGHEVQLPARPPTPPVVRMFRPETRMPTQLPKGLTAKATVSPTDLAKKSWTVAVTVDRTRIPVAPKGIFGPDAVIIERVPPFMVEAVCIRSDPDLRVSVWEVRVGPRRTQDVWQKLIKDRWHDIQSSLTRLCNKAIPPLVGSRVGSALYCIQRGDAEPGVEVLTWFSRNPPPEQLVLAKPSSWYPAMKSVITKLLHPPADSWVDDAPFINAIIRVEFSRAATGLWYQLYNDNAEINDFLARLNVTVAMTNSVNVDTDLDVMIADLHRKVRGLPVSIIS